MVSISPVATGRMHRIIRNIGALSNRLSYGKSTNDGLFYVNEKGYQNIFLTTAYRAENNFYGIENCLKAYSRRDKPIKSSIEHGVYFGPFVNKEEADGGFPIIITFGTQRHRHIASVSATPVLEIGPYIHYAESYVSLEEIAEIKRELGRVLLVFPCHSIETANVKYNFETLIQKVKELEISNCIDTTLYCLYFHDINKGEADRFIEAGKRVVCAGHRSDPLFLSRLKSLIQIADITASNGAGTHMGYCEYLQRPHIFIDMDVVADREAAVAANVEESFWSEKEKELLEVKRAFMTEFGSRQRKEVCEKFWGFSSVRSQNFLAVAFKEADIAYLEMRKKNLEPNEAILKNCPLLAKANATGSLLF